MRLEWDEKKRWANPAKHGLDFIDAPEMFAGPMIIGLDDTADYEEERTAGFGFIGKRLCKIVYTEPDRETIRIISLRKATRNERHEFQKAIKD